MRTQPLSPALLLTLLLAGGTAASENPRAGDRRLGYPEARREAVVDVYHGVEIADPYRWLEDLGSEETHAWMKAEEGLFASALDPDATDRWYRLVDAFSRTGPVVSAPVHAGGRYFFSVVRPDQLHGTIVRREGRGGADAVVLDLDRILHDDEVAGGFSVSPDGAFLGVFVTARGRSWGEVRLFDTATGAAVATLDGLASPTTLWPDRRGFFYVDYGSAASLNAGTSEPRAEVRFHRLGASVGDDAVVFTAEGASALVTPALSDDRRTIVLAVYEGTSAKNRLLVGGVARAPMGFDEVLGDGEHAFRFIGSRRGRFYVYTNLGAAHGRVIVIDPRGETAAREIVPESDAVLAGGSTAGGNAMTLAGDRLVLLYRLASQASLRVFGLDGTPEREVPLAAGWIGSGIVGDPDLAEAWYTFNGFVEPSTVYRLDLASGESRPFLQVERPVDPAAYALEQRFYASADGTRVPIFVAYKRGLERDGTHPVFLYGYGYGGWVAVPWYQPHLLAWLERGGVYAMPGIRGGGEYGDAWRDAGIRRNRPNAIADYLAAAEWLVAERYTSPGKIVANGWSASGSLAAAAVQQRPDLFGAALIGIPSLDLLRYHHFTALKGWTGGYGSSDDPDDFRVLRGFSPLHNLDAARCEPPVLVTVGENDAVVPPLHGYKFVAAMQHLRSEQDGCASPVLLQILRGTGHAFGSTPEHTKRTYAENLAFLETYLR